MAPKPLILFFSRVQHAVSTYSSLSEVARTEVVTSTSRAEFFTDVESKYRNPVVIYRNSSSGSVSPPLTINHLSFSHMDS